MTLSRCFLYVLLLVVLSACASVSGPGREQRPVPTIAAAWVGPDLADDEIDSVSVWHADTGQSTVAATAKSGHRLVLLDGETGQILGQIGKAGTDAGEFKAPNGIAIDGDLAFVVDRDNRRVQVVDLRTRHVVGMFGEPALRRPFGLWLLPHGDGVYHVYVTDSYDIDAGVEWPGGLDGRVKRFAVRIQDDRLDAELESSFGAPDGIDALRYVESIWGDAAHNRLLVADEYPAHRNIKVFDLGGRFTGQVIGEGIFVGEPEGLTLIECADGGGYWLVSDQHAERQAFHLFDRHTLAPAGSFRSDAVRLVDGIWLDRTATARFPGGALFSQHNDTTIVAFDWSTIASALSLPEACASSSESSRVEQGKALQQGDGDAGSAGRR